MYTTNNVFKFFMYAFVVTYDISYVWKTKSETEKEADHLT